MELLATRDLYGQTPRNLASYDVNKLKIAKGNLIPRRAAHHVSTLASAYLKHSETSIERSSDEIQALASSGKLPTPYWDPVLRRNRTARRQLIDMLVGLRLVSFRSHVKGSAGLFFVHKPHKVPAEIRMIVDGRVASVLVIFRLLE